MASSPCAFPLPPEKYAKQEQIWAFYRKLLDGIRQLPGVDAAGAALGLPLTGENYSGTTTVDTQSVPEKDTQPEADQRPVAPGYFEAMGITLLRGRYFNAGDTATSAPVAIVDESMARTYWPNQEAIGKRIKPNERKSTTAWYTIVGVVRHVRYGTLEAPSRTEIYWPYAQNPYLVESMDLAIHSKADPHLLAHAIQKEVLALDADQPVYSVRSMREVMAESMARRRFSMLLLGIFAGAALLLAALGIYGVMSYAVAQRAHEMGIRMALGARGANILWMVLGRSLWLTGAGLAIGLAGSLVLARLLAALLFEVTSTDPTTYLLVALFLAVVAQLASLLPAWRATTIDPVTALRQE